MMPTISYMQTILIAGFTESVFKILIHMALDAHCPPQSHQILQRDLISRHLYATLQSPCSQVSFLSEQLLVWGLQIPTDSQGYIFPAEATVLPEWSFPSETPWCSVRLLEMEVHKLMELPCRASLSRPPASCSAPTNRAVSQNEGPGQMTWSFILLSRQKRPHFLWKMGLDQWNRGSTRVPTDYPNYIRFPQRRGRPHWTYRAHGSHGDDFNRKVRKVKQNPKKLQ